MNREEKDISYHNEIATEYHKVVIDARATAVDVLFEGIDDLVRRVHKGKFLDLGCGTGHMLLRYAREFETVVGVDHSEGMLATAHRNLQARGNASVNLVRSDVIDWAEQSTERFDLITCVGCLHHLSSEQQARVLNAVAKLLANSAAVLIIADPIDDGPLNVPQQVLNWNAASPLQTTTYSMHVSIEPDEAPIPLGTLLTMVDAAGLHERARARCWETFSHSLQPGWLERWQIRRLVKKYGREGNTFVLALGL